MYEQIVDVSSVVTLTVPAWPTRTAYAMIQAESENVRWTDDGETTPTATVGFILFAGAAPTRFEVSQLGLLQFIEVAPSAILNVEYH